MRDYNSWKEKLNNHIPTDMAREIDVFEGQMSLRQQSKIDEKLSKLDDSKIKEKGFLEKVKSSLSSIRSVAQLLSLLLSTAKESGLSIDELKELFM